MSRPNTRSDETVVPSVANCIPLRDTVIFPGTIYPLLIGRASSINALQDAMSSQSPVFLVTQKNVRQDEVAAADLYPVGVVAKIIQFVRLPNDNYKVLVEGAQRAHIRNFVENGNFYQVHYTVLKRIREPYLEAEAEAKKRLLVDSFNRYADLAREIPEDLLSSIRDIDDLEQLGNVVCAHLNVKLETKQELLTVNSLDQFIGQLTGLLISECDILAVGRKIEDQVRHRIQKTQKQIYLHEQMKTIQEELGEQDALQAELAKLEKKIAAVRMPAPVEQKAREELEKLKKTPPLSPEGTVVRNYLDWLVHMPWNVRSTDNMDIRQAQKILDRNHFGLKEPKERILEYLSVISLVKKIKGPIICLVGPPGVGKTSLGRSIAQAMGRKFVRISLGGVRDEAEIRGHRRTYIGALPGKVIQMLRKAGTANPVFLMDEVDKMNADFRGDPASALLEVLDPEQNRAFNDHYLDVDFDLSGVLFITTANVMYSIPYSLQDRMEIIELPGYLEHEKIQIARRFLIPKQLKDHGLARSQLRFGTPALIRLIRNYTKEAGVRNLEREIANVCRKTARRIADKKARKKSFAVDAVTLGQFLGVPKYENKLMENKKSIGVATGLAWTELGGEILNVEVSLMKGKGQLTLTGQLGDVMQESAKAAVSYARSHARQLKIDPDFYEKTDIHIHVPEGAIPKDGPSAGVTMALAVVSALTRRPVDRGVALTGELTLQGTILPVGGLNEKILAAKQAGLKTVVIPRKNRKDLKELPVDLTRGLKIRPVQDINDVIKVALGRNR